MANATTHQIYIDRASRLVRAFEIETGSNISESVDIFYDWLAERASSWKPATIRLYRASLDYYFKLNGLPPFNRSALSTSLSSVRARPDSKSKFVRDNEVEHLEQIAMAGSSEMIVWALAIIKAGIAFGLRPVEWAGAHFTQYENGNLVLKVKNAKYSPVRSHGEYRHLVVVKPDVIDKEIEIAQWIILQIQNKGWSQDQWKQNLKVVRQTLNRIIRAHPKKFSKPSLTLYSARHQFGANAKSANLSLYEIAAMMGHLSIKTAWQHYGRKAKGNPDKVAIMPVEAEVEKVKAYAIKSGAADKVRQYFERISKNKPSWLKDMNNVAGNFEVDKD